MEEKGGLEAKGVIKENSDHRAILLYQNKENLDPKSFRVFNVWLKEESLKKRLKADSFNLSLQSSNVQKLLRSYKEVIRRWNKKSNGNIFKKIEEAERKLAELEDSPNNNEELAIAKMQLEELNLTKDNILKQLPRMLRLIDLSTRSCRLCILNVG